MAEFNNGKSLIMVSKMGRNGNGIFDWPGPVCAGTVTDAILVVPIDNPTTMII